jgi:homoserine O-acetyltransferase
MLFRPDEMKKIYDISKDKEFTCKYLNVESNYGHDAFLVEIEKFEDYVKDALE